MSNVTVVAGDEAEFEMHAFNAVFGRRVRELPCHVADNILLTVAETLCDQVAPCQREWFLQYISERMRPN